MTVRAEVRLNKLVLEQLITHVPERAESAIQKMAEDCEAHAKNSLGTGPRGRTYRVRLPSGSVITHVASAEPGPPANLTSELFNSITAIPLAPFVWACNVGSKKGRALEYGYPPRNLAARPYLLPAVRKVVRDAPPQLKAVYEAK